MFKGSEHQADKNFITSKFNFTAVEFFVVDIHAICMWRNKLCIF